MIRSIFILFLLLSTSLYGQISLRSFNPSDTNFSDIVTIDSSINGKIIIGLGESTHGTHEFTLMRHRLFRYLVEEKGFTTFFLEADYGACLRIERYILGEPDSMKHLLQGIHLWPWMTTEMSELIEWMRSHNMTHEKKVHFVGCDMQLLNDDLIEMQRYFVPNSRHHLLLDSIKEYPSLMAFNKDTAGRNRSEILWKKFISDLDTNDEYALVWMIPEFQMLKLGVEQYFEDFKQKSLFKNHRDSCMAQNMYLYWKFYPETKGIYFAHNGHAMKWKIDRGKHGYSKSAGGYMDDFFRSKYACFAMDFYEGNLLAVNAKKKKLESYYSISKKNKTISGYLSTFPDSILFCPIDKIPDIGKLKMRSIGAVFERSSRWRHQRIYFSKFGGKEMDAIIYIKHTTPTTYFFGETALKKKK